MMKPLPPSEAKQYVLRRTTLANVDFAARYLAVGSGPSETADVRIPRAKMVLLNILGLSSWEGVDPNGALRIYTTPNARYLGGADFVVVKKLGAASHLYLLFLRDK